MRVGGRVVECSGLENQRARKRSGGSNPSPPAIKQAALFWAVFLMVLVVGEENTIGVRKQA